jgi:hypothetical protein
MPYTTAQHMANRLAAAHGYKIAEGAKLSEFQVGEGIIILNRKGEPLMSGLIERIDTLDSGELAVVVGGSMWPQSEFLFRTM